MGSPSAADRATGAVARSLPRLPAALKPRLAGGAPIVVDGLTLDPDIQLLLAARRLSGEPELHDLGVEKARSEYRRQFGSIAPPPLRVYDVRDLTFPGPAGDVPARLYSPPPRDDGLPMLVHYHGGGHVVGGPDTCDAASRLVARHGEVAVLSVDYRMGPEYPFPAAAQDAQAAFELAVAEAERFGVDPGRAGVGGDSAGGNLAAVVAQQARDSGGPTPAFQWLIYPAVDLTRRRKSFDLFGEDFLLTETQIHWFRDNYMVGGDPTDVRASPGLGEDLSGLAPAYVATGGFDPLRDEAEEYAQRLLEAGVTTALQRFPSLPHGFANLTAVAPAAHHAMLEAVGALRMGLAGGAQRDRG